MHPFKRFGGHGPHHCEHRGHRGHHKHGHHGPEPREDFFGPGPRAEFGGHGPGGGRGPRGGHGPGGRGHGGPGGFGGFDGPPFGKRRSRRRRGDVRNAILVLLAEEPRNGYQLIQEITQRSNDTWRPSPGSVYPALQQLEDEVLVRLEVGEDGSKTCHLTEAGVKAAEAIEDLTPWTDEDANESPGEALGQLVRQVAMAAMQVAQAGTEAQMGQAQKLLKDVRRALYRILAEEDGSDGDP